MRLIIPAFAVLLPLAIIWSLLPATEERSLEWQLAILNAGGQVPQHHETVGQFRELLDSLESKCSNSRSEIARVCLAGHRTLQDRGSLLTLLEYTRRMDEKIPADSTFKMDVAEIARAILLQP